MRKYAFARVLAWALVAAGLVMTAISLAAGIFGIVEGPTLFDGTIASTQMFIGMVAGFVAALGFGFHAVFDATETYVGRRSGS